MIQVTVGGSDEFNALMYGQKHPGTLQFLQNQVTNISSTLNDAGRSFFAGARDVYERFNGENAMRLARAAMRKAGSAFQRDEIRPLFTIGEMQQAPLSMQRFIMAEPTIRNMFHQQRCDGYSDTYIDLHPTAVGVDHYDYRRAMNHMVVDSEDEEHEYVCRIFFDDLVDGDRELALDEKVDVLSTWDLMKAFMEKGGEDPTSAFASNL